MLYLLPLLVAVALSVLVLVNRHDRRVHNVFTRAALFVFGSYVAAHPRRERQRERMHAAHIGQTHRVYASRTLFFSGVFGVIGSIVGVYLAGGLLEVLRIPEQQLRATLPSRLEFLADLSQIRAITASELFVVLLFFSATLGGMLAVGVYWGRWWLLERKARARANRIEATFPRTIAFVYAVTRSGMPFPRVLETLTEYQDTYGEAARELGLVLRDMNTFGTDVMTAIRRVALRTPSDSLEEFLKNLSTVLSGGRSVSEYMREQYEQHQEELKAQQNQYLELLATFAEAYVTVFIAGPLFFITILVVIGLLLQDTIQTLRLLGYVGVPFASVAFVLYIDSMTSAYRMPDEFSQAGDDASERLAGVVESKPDPVNVTDGGYEVDRWRVNRERLAAYLRLRPALDVLKDPVRVLVERPLATAVITVPVGLAWVAFRAGALPGSFGAAVRTLDDPVVEALVLVIGGFTLAYELKKRRHRALAGEVPDFLDRMASLNEAGMTIVASIRRLTDTDLGELTDEIQRTWQDIRLGATVEHALLRMKERTGSPTVSRAVTLIIIAMEASGDIAPMLRIAADEAHAVQRLRRRRRQEMVTYLLVIYVAFFVFLGIIAAFSAAFIPVIEETVISAGGLSGGTGAGIGIGGTTNPDAYQLFFYHVTIIQGVTSGFTAGLLGEGKVADGAKHALVMLVIGYVAFQFLL